MHENIWEELINPICTIKMTKLHLYQCEGRPTEQSGSECAFISEYHIVNNA
jgi:hypothetical protein